VLVNKRRHLIRALQIAVLVLQEWGTFYDVESCVASVRDLRTWRGARCDVEIVDGSQQPPTGRRRGGRRHQHTVVKVVEAVRISPSPDWAPVQSTGSSWIEDSLPSKDWNVPPTCKPPDCREDRHRGCSRNSVYQQDRLESMAGRTKTYCVQTIFRISLYFSVIVY